jgi:hypothetical protein
MVEDVLLPVLSYAEALVVVLSDFEELVLEDDFEELLLEDFLSSLTYDFISLL